MRCEVVRWVSDEPQPGWVEARLVDADGRTWVFFDKPSIFDGGGGLRGDATYPQEGVLAGEVIGTRTRPDGREVVTVSTRSPWSVASQEGRTEFEVGSDQLRTGPPA